MIHPLIILLAVTTVFFAPAVVSGSGSKKDAITVYRSLETRTLMLETAQVLAARGGYDLTERTIILPSAGAQDTLPVALPARRTDAWNRDIRYCRGASQSLTATGLALVSAGPDNTLATTCSDALNGNNSSDDIVIALTHADLATWTGRGESRTTFVNQVEDLRCTDPMVVAFVSDRWQCVNADDLISEALDGTAAACPIANGTGEKVWDGPTKSYGACTVVACDTNYAEYSNACIPDTIACTVTNGTGTRTFNGDPYGPCVATTCDTGYRIENGQCVEDGLVVGSCYRLTCTSMAGRTQTVVGNASAADRIQATAPSGESEWLAFVSQGPDGGFTATEAFNCIPWGGMGLSPLWYTPKCIFNRAYDGAYRPLSCQAPEPC
jgi:hypothetical protein